MMEIPHLLVAGAGLAFVVLATLLWRARRGAARLRTRLETASADLERLQMSFSRFAPQELVEQIIASGLPTAGEKKGVTVLFADLVGFTSLSESVEPGVLVKILNGYFERMSRAITDHRGHVSTFIGDGILALFGALEPNPWQGNDALHASLAMRSALAAYNRELAAEGLPELSFGVGLHRGVGIAGLVGSEELKEYTVVGGTVNVAARVQGLTRVHDVDILLTAEVRETLDPRFALRSLPPAELRGIAEPVTVYAAERFEA
jgi:adenylate cyclase